MDHSSQTLMQRNVSIDILRGVSIILVLLHHFNIPYKLHDTWLSMDVLGQSLITAIARNGNYGVTMFFVISGFLITSHTLGRWQQLKQIDIRYFYWSRVARLLPCLMLLLLIVNVLGGFELKPFMNQAPNGIAVSSSLTNLAALSFWMNVLIIKYGWVNYALGVLWSLSVEEIFYLAFPIACIGLKTLRQFAVFLLFFIITAPIYRWLHFAEESGAYLYGYLASFDGIAIGCGAALLAQSINFERLGQRWVQLLTISLMVALYLYAPIKEVSPLGISIMACGTAVLILGRLNSSSNQYTGVAKRGLSTLGRYSYELYLFHLVILGLIKVIAPPLMVSGNEKLLWLAVFLAGTLLLAFVIARFYSIPLNRWIRQKFPFRPTKNSSLMK
ncbi:acyltransferase family protein [Alkanindiges sp. WGS2144]|uniref:acyltransferase family protein n=1 Tax=Alkanindiges sp. WGS2144 TaxID=3366808 RepID=UPI003751853B